MRFTIRVAIAATVIVLAARPAFAQDASGSVTKLAADIGYVETSGNTKVTSLNIGERLTWQSGRYTLSHAFAVVYGRQNDTVNTNNLRTSLRGDYKIDNIFAFFLGAGFDRNKFAGIDKRFEENIGIQAIARATARDTIRFEGGGSMIQQIGLDGTQHNFPAARAAAAWRHVFTGASYFQQNMEFLPNLKESDDWRINTESSLIAPLSTNIGLKLSYVIRYDNLPEPGFRTTDRMFTTGMQFTF